jgi:ketosteroid isomerase-like protein
MTTEGRNSELARRAFDAFNARDARALIDLFDPEIEFFSVTRALAKRKDPYRGHDGLQLYLRDVAQIWRELEVRPRHYIEGDDHVVVYGRVRGRTASGDLVDSPVDWIWKVRGGRLVWGCVYAKRDAATAVVAAGL